MNIINKILALIPDLKNLRIPAFVPKLMGTIDGLNNTESNKRKADTGRQ